MGEFFSPDLALIPLIDFFESLKRKDMLPSRVVLQQQADRLFISLSELGVATVGDLAGRLKTGKQAEALAGQCGLEAELLVLLRREVLSLLPRPLALGSLPGIRRSQVEALAAAGLRTSKDLLQRVHADGGPQAVISITGMEPPQVQALLGMADLSRVNGIGPAFLGMLAEIGIGSMQGFLAQDAGNLLRQLAEAAEARGEKTPPLSTKDLDYCLWYARRLPRLDSFY